MPDYLGLIELSNGSDMEIRELNDNARILFVNFPLEGSVMIPTRAVSPRRF